jgi:hypothetical protein
MNPIRRRQEPRGTEACRMSDSLAAPSDSVRPGESRLRAVIRSNSDNRLNQKEKSRDRRVRPGHFRHCLPRGKTLVASGQRLASTAELQTIVKSGNLLQFWIVNSLIF